MTKKNWIDFKVRFAFAPTVDVTLFGGPFYQAPALIAHNGGQLKPFRIRLAPEINKPSDFDVPIRDFSIPKEQDLEDGLVAAAVAALKGKPVYAGCMGGRGRTGVFFAAMAKLAGIEDPVEYVRENYNPHAVETKEQYDFVTNFDVSGARSRIARASWLRWFL